MKTVSAASVAANRQRIDRLPPLVQDALGELAGAAKEGLLALSVASGSRCCRGVPEVSRSGFTPIQGVRTARDLVEARLLPNRANRLRAAHITYNRLCTPSVFVRSGRWG